MDERRGDIDVAGKVLSELVIGRHLAVQNLQRHLARHARPFGDINRARATRPQQPDDGEASEDVTIGQRHARHPNPATSCNSVRWSDSRKVFGRLRCRRRRFLSNLAGADGVILILQSAVCRSAPDAFRGKQLYLEGNTRFLAGRAVIPCSPWLASGSRSSSPLSSRPGSSPNWAGSWARCRG